MGNEAGRQVVEDRRLDAAVAALGGSIARWTEMGEQQSTAVPGLSLFRREAPTEPISGLYEPSSAWSPRGPSAWCWEMTPTSMTRATT